MSKPGIQPGSSRQNGAVLIVAMIFVLIMTAIVLSVMRSATLEERMASNSRNSQLALHAAESASRYAEATLFTAAPLDPFDGSLFIANCSAGGYCASQSTARWASHSWSSSGTTGSLPNTPQHQIAGVPSQPRYIVELVGQVGGQSQKICPMLVFRITSRGVGADGAEAFVETMYRHQPTSFADGSCG